MLTNILMISLVAMLALLSIGGAKHADKANDYLNVNNTIALRGICCLIVVLVHVPITYQNRIQDMIGSFAYIGVTYFFFISAYGLKYGYVMRKKFFDFFWKKRLGKLLIPIFLINVLKTILNKKDGLGEFRVRTLLYVDEWVRVLLLFYFFFWLVYKIPAKNARNSWCWQDTTICVLVLGCSLVDKLTPIKITGIWPTESMGFVWGLIVFNSMKSICEWLERKWFIKTVTMTGLVFVVGIIYLKIKSILFWGDYCWKIFLGALFLFLLICICERINISNKVNMHLGNISYEVYLAHGYIFRLLESIVHSEMESGIFIWIAIVITIVVSYVMHIVSSKIYKAF